MPHAEALGSVDALQHLAEASREGSDASRLRRVFEREGSVEGMVNAAIQHFRGDRRMRDR